MVLQRQCLFSGRNKIPGYLPGKEVVMENWLSIAVAVYLIGMVLYGHYKGFIKLAVSAVALIITFATIHVAMPQVTKTILRFTVHLNRA